MKMGRRRFLLAGAGLAAAAGGLGLPPLLRRLENFRRARVAVIRAPDYGASLAESVASAISLCGFDTASVKGKSVLLKPNLVEPSKDRPQVNTHPDFVRVLVEYFRRLGAGKVVVGEGPGNCPDTWAVLECSGLAEVLREDRVDFADLNRDDLVEVDNRLGYCPLKKFYLPAALLRSDIVVTLPKMKTHHWAGVTLSMKNLFGCMPGIYYGWPKNLLHFAGIGRAILDIAATVKPALAIVDGIVGMEGDGPIMGQAKHCGVIVAGTNLAAVDATASRLMGIEPSSVAYLAAASGTLGPIMSSHIAQAGENPERLVQHFRTAGGADWKVTS